MPFAPRVHEAVNGDDFQNVGPPSPFTADGQRFSPKTVQAELIPELTTQPAGPPLAGSHEPHFQKQDADGGNLAKFGIKRQVFLGKESDLLRGCVSVARKIAGSRALRCQK